MDLISLRRQHVAWAIQQNPVTITIQRTEKVDMGGYFNEVKSTKGPFAVRIFTEGNRVPLDVSTLAGTKQIDKGWGLLADYNADIKAGPNVLDEFDTPVGHFIIKAVYPQYVQGQLVGYQADLEKVS
ncbi:hypothetical protein D2962_09470 [Biomaibacter acetigenes]|uniref:Uncharacterized protein n=1 Tax=Biomaibacter acetigenes TaxID=2316383 RepID=A0A3G2R6T6_9FIRM|nr:hypothetical protein [Biomaibacter acetigenes]AYO30808.1 hypothetical protein D2962_09470 [Biomaibacter acetigenes]